MNNEIIASDEAPPAFGPFSQAVMKDGCLYTSGLMPFLPGSGDLVDADIELQTHQAMRNMQAILAAAGMTFDDVVFVTIYTTDMQEIARINEVYGAYFAGGAYPSRAAVGVAALAKGAKVELVATARK